MTNRAQTLARWVLANEGAWSDHAADRGGRTMFGVTESVASKHGLDVERITEADAIRIYVADYWRWDWVQSDRVAAKLLDLAVNCGPGTAVRLLQRALRLLGDLQVVEDGVAGPVTQLYANRERPDPLLAALSYVQMQRYLDIVAADEGQRVFIRGWLSRAVRPINV
jgi:lysozyme family protein